MRIGIIGAGHIGGTLAGHFVGAGHEVAVSNSRGPDTLGNLVEELGAGARAMTVEEAATFGNVIVGSVPFGRYRELLADGFDGKIVIDTNNYDPRVTTPRQSESLPSSSIRSVSTRWTPASSPKVDESISWEPACSSRTCPATNCASDLPNDPRLRSSSAPVAGRQQNPHILGGGEVARDE